MKQINKFIFALLLCFVPILQIMAQDYYDTVCWVRVNDPQYYATDGIMHSQKAELNSLFALNGVQYYEKAYPFFRICNSEAVMPAFAMRDETKTTLKT